jgi:uncharacterized protein YciI
MVDRNMSLEDFLTHRHCEIPLFVVMMKAGPKLKGRDTPEGAEMLRQHFLYLWELEAQGKLLGSGPLDPGTPDQEGMAIIAASSREEAEAIAHEEPFGKAGWRINRVRAFNLNEGLATALGRQLTGKGRPYRS